MRSSRKSTQPLGPFPLLSGSILLQPGGSGCSCLKAGQRLTLGADLPHLHPCCPLSFGLRFSWFLNTYPLSFTGHGDGAFHLQSRLVAEAKGSTGDRTEAPRRYTVLASLRDTGCWATV